MTPNARYQAKYRERYVRRGNALEAILVLIGRGHSVEDIRLVAEAGLAKDVAGGEG